MTRAHAQDFERKRRPDVPESASPYHGAQNAGVESSDDEEEEEEGEEEISEGTGGGTGRDGEERRADEEDVQNVQDAGEILRRHQSATE